MVVNKGTTGHTEVLGLAERESLPPPGQREGWGWRQGGVGGGEGQAGLCRRGRLCRSEGRWSEWGGARRKPPPSSFFAHPRSLSSASELAAGVSLIAVYQHIDVVTVKRKPKHSFYLMPLGEKGPRVDGEGFSSEADEEGMFSFVEIVLLAKL